MLTISAVTDNTPSAFKFLSMSSCNHKLSNHHPKPWDKPKPCQAKPKQSQPPRLNSCNSWSSKSLSGKQQKTYSKNRCNKQKHLQELVDELRLQKAELDNMWNDLIEQQLTQEECDTVAAESARRNCKWLRATPKNQIASWVKPLKVHLFRPLLGRTQQTTEQGCCFRNQT